MTNFSYFTKALVIGVGISACLATVAAAAPVLDGSGFGAASATVAYDPAAPTSNFGAPGPTTSGAAYDIYTRNDSTYAYVLVSQTGVGGTSAGAFSNLYFGTGATAMNGSDVGFEVTNSDVFAPGSSPTQSTVGTGIDYAVLNGGTSIEFAVPFTYFETDPQKVGFSEVTAANPDIVLRLSQSFGYSVAGGATYGPDRLGLIVDPNVSAAPEPGVWALMMLGVGMIGYALGRGRRAQPDPLVSESVARG